MKLLIAMLLSLPLVAATYDIGPGQTYTSIGSAPWSTMAPGDTWNIHAKTPITLTTTGTCTNCTTITFTTSTASVGYGSSLWFSGAVASQLTWATCGQYGSGIYGSSVAGSACTSNQVTVNDPVTIPSGTTVYFQPPYYEKLILTNACTSGSPCTVNGIADATTGQLPILDQHNCSTGPNMAHTGSAAFHDSLGFLMTMYNAGETGYAGYITISNLRVQTAPYGTSLTCWDGSNASYSLAYNVNVRMENSTNITFSHVDFFTGETCFFANTNTTTFPAQFTLYLLMHGNHFYNCSDSSGGDHASYVEGVGTIYEYNWYDNLAPGAVGDQIKDRSSGTVVRYNYISGGGHLIDFDDSQAGQITVIPQANLTTSVACNRCTTISFSSSVAAVQTGAATSSYSTEGVPVLTTISSISGNGTTATATTAGNHYMQTGDNLWIDAYFSGTAFGTSDMAPYTVTVIDPTHFSFPSTVNMNESGLPGMFVISNPVLWPNLPTVSSVNTGANTVTVSQAMFIPSGTQVSFYNPGASTYRQRFVYGNIFNAQVSQNGSIGIAFHDAWDTDYTEDGGKSRAGDTYYYFNTIYVTAGFGQAFYQVPDNGTTIHFLNNILYAFTPSGTVLAGGSPLMQDGNYTPGSPGNITGGSGLMPSGWQTWSNNTNNGAATNMGGFTSKTSSGYQFNTTPAGGTQSSWLPLASTDFHLLPVSPAIGAAAALPSIIASGNAAGQNFTPVYQYVHPQSFTTRANVNDLGAFQGPTTNPGSSAIGSGFLGAGVLQ